MKNLLQFRVKVLALTVIFLIGISGGLFAQKIAIIDAGSSGSRLYVYNIKDDKKIELVYATSPPATEADKRPLSGVGHDSNAAKKFLFEMTKDYQGPLDEQTPLYILATAGMRLVNKEQADEIYAQLRANASEISSKFDLREAMTISGQYEGLYAWIAVNYKKGELTFSDSKWNYNPTSYGILEIGGASMQIAFATTGTWIGHKNLQNIYSKSYLCGGVDQIFETYKNCIEPFTFNELENVSRLYPDGIQFLGLGKPIETVLGYTPAAVAALKRSDDETNKYHPWMTNYYINQVIQTFNLIHKLMTPDVKSSWTEGAALDILINGMHPEKFNYDLQKPN